MSKLRVLIADDHPVIREGVRNIINANEDMEIVGEAPDGTSLPKLVDDLHPDVLILDLSMPGKSGLELTREIHASSPLLKILIFTVHEQVGYLRQLLSAGASGYILKLACANELERAIRVVAGGANYVDPLIAGGLMGMAPHRINEEDKGTGEQLSHREIEVMKLVSLGHGNKEVAKLLQLSIKTVETYKARSMEKLGLKNRVDIIQFAQQLGWLKTD